MGFVLVVATTGLATLVDRKSRYTLIIKIRSKHADHVQQKIKERLKQLDMKRRHSVTIDHGTEFAHCHRLQKHPGVVLYLAEPGKPHQRGTNENTNDLIRQYFSKDKDLSGITRENIEWVKRQLNNRSHKCLGFKTPNVVIFDT